MRLTGKQIAELGIVRKIGKDCIQQVGVDLELIEVSKVIGQGFIPKEGKTVLADRYTVKPSVMEIEGKERSVWILDAGDYDITLAQSCKLGAKHSMKLIQRSSIFRNAGKLSSSMFDPGFETENIGTILHLDLPLIIEVGARVCQAYVDECYEVTNLYQGQFQNDNQREKI